MSMIKIEVPTDNKQACEVFGKALLELSGFIERTPVLVKRTDLVQETPPELTGTDDPNIINTSVIESKIPVSEGGTAPDSANTNKLDTDGIPWDVRIHSHGKTLLGSGTWRLAKRPKEHATKEAWEQYIEMVKAELKDKSETENLSPEQAFGGCSSSDAGGSAQQEKPPAIDPDEEITFAKLMTLITTNTGKIGLSDVLTIIGKPEYGLSALPELTTDRPDLLPFVYTDVKAFIDGH